jgi:SAM-dependent methyltransferase
MATIEENKRLWETQCEWSEAGDEWSVSWGGTRNLWEYVIYPRIKSCLPARVIVEIAPGFGRWTQFLQQHCEQLIAVDLTSKCVEHCRQRFAGSPHVQVYQNDGRTIPISEGASVDFVFSFDSLVHVESETLQAYLKEIARVLRPNGAAFLHHSNLGKYKSILKLSRKLPNFVSQTALKFHLIPIEHWRAESVTAAWLSSVSREYQLYATRQELVNWGNRRYLIDCFTTLRRSPDRREPVLRNYDFMKEAKQIRLAHLSL